jgi:hypothetical protein
MRSDEAPHSPPSTPERRTAAHWATVLRWWRGWDPSVDALPPPKSLPANANGPRAGAVCDFVGGGGGVMVQDICKG